MSHAHGRSSELRCGTGKWKKLRTRYRHDICLTDWISLLRRGLSCRRGSRRADRRRRVRESEALDKNRRSVSRKRGISLRWGLSTERRPTLARTVSAAMVFWTALCIGSYQFQSSRYVVGELTWKQRLGGLRTRQRSSPPPRPPRRSPPPRRPPPPKCLL